MIEHCRQCEHPEEKGVHSCAWNPEVAYAQQQLRLVKHTKLERLLAMTPEDRANLVKLMELL